MLLALLWWGILLLKKNNEIYELQRDYIESHQSSGAADTTELNKISTARKRQHLMVVGEGLVFVIALITGIWLINRGYRREIDVINQRKNFLLAITHELKSPLASIGLIFETLQKRSLNKNDQTKMLQNGIKETARLTSLIDNLLLSAKLDRFYQPDYITINLNDILKSVVRDFKNSFPTATVAEFYEPLPMIGQFDKHGLYSVFYNILENAIKYSDETKDIKIRSEINPNHFSVEISDLGKGIPQNEKEKIFEQFYRSGNEEIRSTKGTGLGLYIAKKMIDLHHGRIEVGDNIPRGSIFTIYLPVKKT